MKVLELLIGKKIKVKSDVGEFILEIKEVKRNHHSQEISEGTPQNDWWAEIKEWDTFMIYFTNGGKKEYYSLDEIEIIED